MIDDTPNRSQRAVRPPLNGGATVTDLASRRPEENVLASVTFVFGGVHYGTFPVRAPYAAGKPIALYLVPSTSAPNASGGALHGALDCLITDDVALALDEAR